MAGMSQQPTDGKIVVDGIDKRFRSESGMVDALRDVNFAVEEGEFICIIGASGAGKTTLFRIIAGLEPASKGTVWLDGEPIDGPGMDRGMVFQEYGLFPWRTVMGNVTFGLEQRGLDSTARRDRAQEMIDLVGLDGFEDSYPKELSGGMKQRVGIARALAVDPEILLLDEPFGSVDARTRDRLHDELLDIWAETQQTVVFVTHDIDEAVKLADRIVVLDDDPGTVQSTVTVDVDRPRERTSHEFVECVARIRDELGRPTDASQGITKDKYC